MYNIFEIDSYTEYLVALEKSTTELFWMTSKNLTAYLPDLPFADDNEYDRTHNHAFLHLFNQQYYTTGVFLCSKHAPLTESEVVNRFPIERKEWDIVASGPKLYDTFTIDTYDEYLVALEKSTTELFWMTGKDIVATIPDITFEFSNTYDRTHNHAFVHVANSVSSYNGLFLCSTHAPLSEREVSYRHPVNRKEWNIVASIPKPYDTFTVDNYNQYLTALYTSTTELFWMTSKDIVATIPDIFFGEDNTYDRTHNHAFVHVANGVSSYNGLFLCSTHASLSEREVTYRHPVERKEWDIVASIPKPYDIVFISYDEINATENYNLLLARFPDAKRVHGIKGIHQAHIAAAKLCTTRMFWIVDGDAIVADTFNFDYHVASYNTDAVHVWQSSNPVNDMIYGYGGIKLFPTTLTIDMDTSSPDMTTSITPNFNIVKEVSNITAFNTSPYNAWKSAFRECVKLSSKVITNQNNAETNFRLRLWKQEGADREYGKYAIAGAVAGEIYGFTYKADVEKLKLINNFDWLEQQFNEQ